MAPGPAKLSFSVQVESQYAPRSLSGGLRQRSSRDRGQSQCHVCVNCSFTAGGAAGQYLRGLCSLSHRCLARQSLWSIRKIWLNWLMCKFYCLIFAVHHSYISLFSLYSLFVPHSVKTHSSSTSLNQQHQSAAKDLTSSPGPSSASTIQVTYLPSSGQRSKRPKHFLELKNFKDNYNTLESTL